MSQYYTGVINELLACKVPPNHNVWFQLDGATAVISMVVLRGLFLQGWFLVLGTVPGPPCSSDLTAPDFSLWGYLKSNVCSRRPVDLNALKQAIQDEIINI